MSLAIAVLMWGLVLSLSIRASKRSKNILLWCASLIAVSLTSNVSFVDQALDGISPFPNLFHLLSNLILIFGVFLLAITIIRGARTAINDKPQGLGIEIYGVVFVMISMVVSFFMIKNPHSSTRAMVDYWVHLPAAFYSGIQFLYLSFIFIQVMAICLRAIPQMTITRFRIGFSTMVVGCLCAVLMVISVICMDILHVRGDLATMRSVEMAYDILRLGAVFFLCVGLSIPTLGKQLDSTRHRRQAAIIEPKLRQVWIQTVGEHSDQSLIFTKSIETGEPMARLHRMVVEIYDWSLNEEGGALSPSQSAVLSKAESLCMQAASTRTGV